MSITILVGDHSHLPFRLRTIMGPAGLFVPAVISATAAAFFCRAKETQMTAKTVTQSSRAEVRLVSGFMSYYRLKGAGFFPASPLRCFIASICAFCIAVSAAVGGGALSAALVAAVSASSAC